MRVLADYLDGRELEALARRRRYSEVYAPIVRWSVDYGVTRDNRFRKARFTPAEQQSTRSPGHLPRLAALLRIRKTR